MRQHQQQCGYVLAELQRNMGLEASRGVASNWNTQLSFPTLAAFTTDAPIGFIAQAEDTGLSYQFSGTAWVVFPSAATLPSIPEAFTKYVTKTGSDATGDGSINKPYLTIGAAVTAIANGGTSAQPWKIAVGPGQFVYSAIDPWTFVVGAGRNLTTLTGAAANMVTANWATAGAQEGGIVECALGYASTLDFAAVAASTGSTFYFLDSCLLGFSTAWTASSNLQKLFIQNVVQITTTAGLTHTFTNFSPCRLDHVDFRGNAVTFTLTAAYAAGPVMISAGMGTLTVNCANAAPNTITVGVFGGTHFTATVTTGDASFITGSFSCWLKQQLQSNDAAQTFTFNTVVAGATRLFQNADIDILAGITAPRTYTFGDATNNTRVKISNQNEFPLSLVFTGSSALAGTYVPGHGSFEMFFLLGAWRVVTSREPQTGTGVFVNGVSAAIPCDITQGISTVHIERTAFAGGAVPLGEPTVLDADITTGTFLAGTGQFIARAKDLTTGADVATDQSNFRWTVIR